MRKDVEHIADRLAAEVNQESNKWDLDYNSLQQFEGVSNQPHHH